MQRTEIALVVVLLALTGVGATAPVASAATGQSAASAAAPGAPHFSRHLTKAQPVLLRKGHNPTGRTIRGLAPARPATSLATTGPIVVAYEAPAAGSPCQTFPSTAKAAVQAAVDVWNVQILSTVKIDVDLCWLSFSDPSILGGAGATEYAKNTQTSTYYPLALANSLAGRDLDTANPEISGEFSLNAPWYLGTDGNTPTGKYDFETVVLHEIGHGLGFAGSGDGLQCPPSNIDTGLGYFGIDPQGCFGLPDATPLIWDRSVVDGAGTDIVTYPNASTALGAVYRSGTGLQWRGSNGVLANGGVRPVLYAPSTWIPGTSYSHLDEATYPEGGANSLMTPFLSDGVSMHQPGPIALGMMQDMGWLPCGASGPISTLFHPKPTTRAYSAGTVVQAGHVVDLPMLGHGGLPSSGVDAVVVNVQVGSPTASGYISVTPGCVTSATAVQEFTAGKTVSNQVTVRLDAAGRLRLRMSAGKATVFVDVAGYYSTDVSGDTFHAIPTTRVDPAGTVVTAGTPAHLTLAGVGIVPTDGTLAAATFTVEVQAPTAAGYVRVTPDLEDSATALQVFTAHQTISNLATVQVAGGKVQIKMSAGSARVFVDVNGYYTDPSVTTGDAFHPVTTARINPAGTTVASTTDLHLQVAGNAGVPPSGASGIVGVVEVQAPTVAGYVRTVPDLVVSQTATQEFVAGQTISNAVAVGLGAGKIQLHMSAGRATLFIDVAGYFAPVP